MPAISRSRRSWWYRSVGPAAALLLGAALLPAQATTVAAPFALPLFASTHDPESGQLLYRLRTNYTAIDGAPVRAQVIYQDAQGATIAESRLDFTIDPYVPDIATVFTDSQNENGLLHENWSVLLYHADRPGAAMRGHRKKPPPNLTADIGLARYVHANLDTLLAGDKLRFSVASILRRKILRCTARLDSAASTGGRIVIVVHSGLGPMRWSFDRQSRALLEYSGPSNILSTRGKARRVLIRYANGNAE